MRNYIHYGYTHIGLIEETMSATNHDRMSITPSAFHIIIALAGGARHGYAIMKAVEDETEGHVVLGPGTLYRSIKQLLEAELIEECAGPSRADRDDARRRYYRLTRRGRKAGALEAERLARTLDVARTKRLLDN